MSGAIPLLTKGKICFASIRTKAIDNRIVNLKINLKRDFLHTMTIKILTNIVKGDTIIFEAKIDTDITGWKIRAELSDNCENEIRLATVNVTGGSTNQIEVTDITPTKSTFLVKVPSGATKCFADEAKFEIEVETDNLVSEKPEILTVFQADIDFKREEITWTNVTS